MHNAVKQVNKNSNWRAKKLKDKKKSGWSQKGNWKPTENIEDQSSVIKEWINKLETMRKWRNTAEVKKVSKREDLTRTNAAKKRKWGKLKKKRR